jgi:hypothetical protein
VSITRIPITTSVDPEYSGSGIVTKGSMAKNILYSTYVNKTVYATQRPALNIRSQAFSSSLDPKGRGIVYWDAASVFVICVDDTVYVGDYSAPATGGISAGKNPVTFLELNNYLIVLDQENNEGWYLESSSPTTINAITDTDFPANIPNVAIAGGGAVLDGYLFVSDTDGTIYNSDLEDPTTWDGLNFIKSTREQDAGLFLTKHHDHIVSIGAKSIEFFFDAGNPVGSPLQRRQDISYQTGALDYKTVFNTGEKIYFIGSEKTGTIGLFQIQQFTLTKISTDAVDTFLAVTRSRSKFEFLVAGATVGDHALIFITTLSPTSTTYDPQYTLVYDGASKGMVQFETNIADITAFSVVGSTERSSVDSKETTLLFLSGDFGSFDLTFARLDSAGFSAYVDADYIVNQDDYIQDIGQDLVSNFEALMVFPESDFSSLTNKFINRMALVGTTTAPAADDEPIYISWTDDHYRTFSNERQLDTGLNRSLTQLGKFRRRAFNLRYTGTDILRIEGIEVDLRASQYA